DWLCAVVDLRFPENPLKINKDVWDSGGTIQIPYILDASESGHDNRIEYKIFGISALKDESIKDRKSYNPPNTGTEIHYGILNVPNAKDLIEEDSNGIYIEFKGTIGVVVDAPSIEGYELDTIRSRLWDKPW
ncbi:hypothetical protein, partial [Paramaledivibacter caminithermalis]